MSNPKRYFDPIRKVHLDEAGEVLHERRSLSTLASDFSGYEWEPADDELQEIAKLYSEADLDSSGVVVAANGRPLRKVLIRNPGESPIEALYDESTKVIMPIML